MPKRSLAVLATAAMLWGSDRAQAWDKQGHMVVAYIAYKQLQKDDPQLLASLIKRFDDLPRHDELLALLTHPTPDADLNKFLAMATWPDAIKRNPRTHKVSSVDDSNGEYPKSHEGWHYVNYPLPRHGTPTGPQAPAGANGVDQVQNQVEALFKTGTDPAERAKALCWVEHIVGDLHQPLHCAALIDSESDFDPPQGDSGGNKITVDTDDLELHAYWDNLAGKGLSEAQAQQTGDRILGEIAPATFTAAQISATPGAWAAESFELARTKVYTILPSDPDLRNVTVHITPAYDAGAQQVAERQVALAGLRLAAYLRANQH